MDHICKNVNTYGCVIFLMKYGKGGNGQLINSILEYSKRKNTLSENYRSWIKWKEDNNVNFGGKPVYISNIPWMEPFWLYDYDFGKVKGWSEVFQFVVNLENEKNGSPTT